MENLLSRHLEFRGKNQMGICVFAAMGQNQPFVSIGTCVVSAASCSLEGML